MTRGGQSERERESEWESAVDLWPPRPAPRSALRSRRFYRRQKRTVRRVERGRINSSALERCLCQYSSAQGLPSYPLWGRNSCRHRVDEMDLAIGFRRIRRSVSTWRIRIRDEAFYCEKSAGILVMVLCFCPLLISFVCSAIYGWNNGHRFAEGLWPGGTHPSSASFPVYMRRLSQDQEITIPFHSQGLIFCLSDGLVCVNISSIKTPWIPMAVKMSNRFIFIVKI